MRQVVLAQKVSWAAALATPPAERGYIVVVVLSDPLWTWYKAPLYALYRARVVEWAATQGVPI